MRLESSTIIHGIFDILAVLTSPVGIFYNYVESLPFRKENINLTYI